MIIERYNHLKNFFESTQEFLNYHKTSSCDFYMKEPSFNHPNFTLWIEYSISSKIKDSIIGGQTQYFEDCVMNAFIKHHPHPEKVTFNEREVLNCLFLNNNNIHFKKNMKFQDFLGLYADSKFQNIFLKEELDKMNLAPMVSTKIKI